MGSVWLKTLKYSARNSSFKASTIGKLFVERHVVVLNSRPMNSSIAMFP